MTPALNCTSIDIMVYTVTVAHSAWWAVGNRHDLEITIMNLVNFVLANIQLDSINANSTPPSIFAFVLG